MLDNDSFVEYHVKINPRQLEITVVMTLSGQVAHGDIHLEIPTWVPGDYSFVPYTRDLFDVKAKITDTNENLSVLRDGYNAFTVQNGNGGVTVTYKSYAYEIEFGEAAGILDGNYAILLGTRYLHSPAYLGSCRVSYGNLPDGWKIHHPAGARREGETNKWTYPSFEILLDTPVVFGHFDLLHRQVEGTDFYFAFVDKGVGYESEVNKFVDHLAVVAQKMYNIFGAFPFENYTFIMSLNPTADWGLEHLTSTMCGLGPEVFVDKDRFANGIRVCAHELFHAWNVRRLRPAPLNQLEHHLTNGSFTEGLWMAEGFTRYYEFLISTRVNAYTPEQFFSAIVGYYEHLTIQPAYHRVSAVDSSLASYLNHEKYPGRVNNSIDYYDKGMLIAFDLDVTLRLHVPGCSLDRAFDEFYRKYVHGTPPYAGYTTENVIDFFNDIAPELGNSIGKAVTQPQGLDTIQQLQALGFDAVCEAHYYLGIVFENDGAPTIYNVIDNSPAGFTGLAPNDVITLINGFEYSESALDWVATHEQPLTLSIQRGYRQLAFKVIPNKREKITSLVWEGNDKQAKVIGDWLDRDDFRPKKGEVFSLSFYENFHGIEKVV